MAAAPTMGDVKSLNKVTRQIKSQPVKLQYWPLTRPLRILGFPDASQRNNDDGSSQRGMKVFLAESRERSSKDGMSYGSLVDYESQKLFYARQCQNCTPIGSVLVHASFSVDYGWNLVRLRIST